MSQQIKRQPNARRFHATRRFVTIAVLSAATAVALPAQLRRAMPDSLTDREFWDFFTTMSEPGGTFVSENFVSNEQTYQHVIPTLQRTVKPGGVYLGVGPEQNFTYIANVKPRMAVIFDIRRQNAMAHLMYKAIFELSPTRADFVSLLFSRALPSLPASVKPVELFAAASVATASGATYDKNRQAILDQLMIKHGFALTVDDVQSIDHVYSAFFEAGPSINYGYRPGFASQFRPTYATYGQLQSLTNAAGENMAFLASEENYRVLRNMHLKNLVVPVVGDFAGPKAIRAVGDYVKQRGGKISAFYLSNVEQYLFRQGSDAEHFYQNVGMLPVDSTSTFIRSVPPNGGMFAGNAFTLGPSFSAVTNAYSVSVVDSGGVRVVVTTTTDSSGKAVTTRSIDSTRTSRASALEIFRSLRARDDSLLRARLDSVLRIGARDSATASTIVFGRDTAASSLGLTRVGVGGVRSIVMGGAPLVSGLASIRETLAAFVAGNLTRYDQAIALTKTSDWK